VDDHQAAVHRSIVVIDVERFSDPARTDAHLLVIRDGMYRALRRAFFESGIDWARCTVEDRGDGMLILVPPEVPKSWLAARVPACLAAALAGYNSTSSYESRIRLRMALHAGEVLYDAYGVISHSVNQVFRLIEAPALKAALAASPDLLALIVSDWFFHEVICHEPTAMPSRFSLLRVDVKDTQGTGWMRLLGPTVAPCLCSCLTLSLHDRHYIGRDGLPVRHQVRQIIEAAEDGLDRLPYRADANVLSVRVIDGGKCIRPLAPSGKGLYNTEILLDQQLNKGETIPLEYETSFCYEAKPLPEFRRIITNGIEGLGVRIEFHPEKMPRDLWWAVWDGPSGEIIERQPVGLNSGRFAHRYMRAIENPVSVGFAWRW
jgi:hypothetical protein